MNQKQIDSLKTLLKQLSSSIDSTSKRIAENFTIDQSLDVHPIKNLISIDIPKDGTPSGMEQFLNSPKIAKKLIQFENERFAMSFKRAAKVSHVMQNKVNLENTEHNIAFIGKSEFLGNLANLKKEGQRQFINDLLKRKILLKYYPGLPEVFVLMTQKRLLEKIYYFRDAFKYYLDEIEPELMGMKELSERKSREYTDLERAKQRKYAESHWRLNCYYEFSFNFSELKQGQIIELY